MLDDLNEDTLLQNIETRYQGKGYVGKGSTSETKQRIYTTIGSSILISLNPYARLPIYSIGEAKR